MEFVSVYSQGLSFTCQGVYISIALKFWVSEKHTKLNTKTQDYTSNIALCSSRISAVSYPPQGRLLEIPRGRGS